MTMSRTVSRTCDRCRGLLVDPGSIMEVTSGDLRRHLSEPLDLCSDCGPLFLDWLRSGHQTHQDGPGEALADTAVASMSLTSEAFL